MRFPCSSSASCGRAAASAYEVLNAGVQGYNTENELAFLRARGLALEPETVVVGFNLNDFDYAPAMGPLGILTRDPGARVSTWSPANISEFYVVLRWLIDHAGTVPGRTGDEHRPCDPAARRARSSTSTDTSRHCASSTTRIRTTDAGRRWSTRCTDWASWRASMASAS